MLTTPSPLSLAGSSATWTNYLFFIPQIAYTGELNYIENNGKQSVFFPLFLLFLFVFYFLFFNYMEQVIPDEFGLSKSCCFCLKKKNRKVRRAKKDGILDVENPELKGKYGMIKVENLVKQFGEFKAVNGISFDIYSDVVTCILGHNGAGKSTLINMMCGILKNTSGDVSPLTPLTTSVAPSNRFIDQIQGEKYHPESGNNRREDRLLRRI